MGDDTLEGMRPYSTLKIVSLTPGVHLTVTSFWDTVQRRERAEPSQFKLPLTYEYAQAGRKDQRERPASSTPGVPRGGCG